MVSGRGRGVGQGEGSCREDGQTTAREEQKPLSLNTTVKCLPSNNFEGLGARVN